MLQFALHPVHDELVFVTGRLHWFAKKLRKNEPCLCISSKNYLFCGHHPGRGGGEGVLNKV